MLERWPIDFSLMEYLPEIRSDEQLAAFERVKNAKDDRMQRTKLIFQGKTLDEAKGEEADNGKKKKKPPAKKKKKKGEKEKEFAFDGEIEEEMRFLE